MKKKKGEKKNTNNIEFTLLCHPLFLAISLSEAMLKVNSNNKSINAHNECIQIFTNNIE